MTVLLQAFETVFSPGVLLVILSSALFGLFIGAMPGLTATMATALLVPITFFMEPVAGIAAIVTATAMAIFAGDIPAALLRIPGTPASAAYADETFLMRQKGELELALGVNVMASVIGGLIGTAILVTLAPQLADVALNFSSYEYFWLSLLGLSCAALVSKSSPVKGIVALALGLLMSTVGLDVVMGLPRFTFGLVDLAGGLSLIAVLIGVFAVSELFRKAGTLDEALPPPAPLKGSILRGTGTALWRYRTNTLRGSLVGTLIGALPGAGADIAAWISYAMAKRFSRTPERFGTGHVEGVVEASAANNAALSGAYVPALVFGIPGDSITAIVIGVLLIKGLTPGPTVFTSSPDLVAAIFLVFFIANLLMIPLGLLAIRAARYVLRVEQRILYPIILACCVVGAFAVNNSVFDLWIVLALGALGWLMEENGYPVAPMVLGLVLGRLVEETFMNSMIKSNGSLLAFVERPLAGALAAILIGIWVAAGVFAYRRQTAQAEKGM